MGVSTERWVTEGLSPPTRKRLAAVGSSLGDGTDFVPAGGGGAYTQGHVTREAARVRLLLAGGRPPVELGLVDPGDRFPVRFFIDLFAVESPDSWKIARVVALDQAGRVIARCTPGAPPVGDCRNTR